MAWFALSLRAPVWLSSPSTPSSPSSSPPTSRSPSMSPSSSSVQPLYSRKSYFPDDTRHMPRLTPQPADVYTVRIVDPNLRSGLLTRLMDIVRRAGAVEIIELTEGRGFNFSMPLDTEDPLTGYHHGRLLEEGYISVSKVVFTRAETTERKEFGQNLSTGSCEEEETIDEDGRDHPNLRLQWEWTEARPSR